MTDKRVYNFSAGPSQLPVEVLKEAADQMLNYKGSGMSVMEMSHRSSTYQKIFDDTKATLKKVLNVPDNYKILLLQGGATQEFTNIALNLMVMVNQIISLQEASLAKLQKKRPSLGMFILPITVRTTILQKFLHRIS